MNLAQTIVHYAPSYALEVLIENLQSEKSFTDIFAEQDHGKEKSHDAFFDTKNSIKLFLYFMAHLYELIQSHPNLAQIIRQTQGIRNEIIQLDEYTDIPKIKIRFPALQRIVPSNTNMTKTKETIDTNTLENQKKYYIGDVGIKALLTALAGNKNIILAFQNIQKLDIAKSVLNDI